MKRPIGIGRLNVVKRPIGIGRLNVVKRPIGIGRLNVVKRPLLVGVAAVLVIVAGLLVAGHLRKPAVSDCDTVRSLLAYNAEFREQTKESAKTNNPELSTAGQYRQWADQIKAYAGQISEPALSKKANTAAQLASQTADLVPKYRAKPDDPHVAADYARIGIEYGNAITMLDYSCAPNG